MLQSPPIEFSTARLKLQAARPEHAATLFNDYTGDFHASQFLPRGPHADLSRTEAVIHAWGAGNWMTSKRFVWSIINRSDDRPIGLFLMFLEHESAEIHYGIRPLSWGKGLATEAGLAVMDWVRQQSDLSSVHTTCAASHVASCRVLEKIGLRRHQFIAGALPMKATGEKLDGWSYVWRRTE